MNAFKTVVLVFAFAAAVAFAQPVSNDARLAEASPVASYPVKEPGRWLLFLSGILVAGWVAHRRLVHNF